MLQVRDASKQKRNEMNENQQSLSIDIVDPNLNIPGDIKNSKNSIKSSIKSNFERNNIKKSLSLELFNEILKNPNYPEEEKEKIKNLINKINENKYYYCYGDLSNPESQIIKIFEEKDNIIERPFVLALPEELNYDVELYKIGKTCKGLKKRYAIIKRGGFYSSKKPLSNIDRNKLKDKTQFIKGSLLMIETKDSVGKAEGEWSNKKKDYRIRINYSIVPGDNSLKNIRSFFLYFDDEKKMREVEIMLFGIILNESTKKKIRKHLADITNTLTEGNSFYTIMKILSVKNKIKKRKIAFNAIERAKNLVPIGKLNIEKKLLKRLSIQRRETNQKKIFNIEPKPEPEPEPEEKPKPIFHAKPQEPELTFEKQFSDFMPLISNISPLSSKIINNGKSLNLLVKKYELLKKNIPKENNFDNYELSDNGVCFSLPNGVEIGSDYNYGEINDENNNFKLEQNTCNNAKFLYFNKNKPEIQFKADNYDDQNNSNLDVDYSDANVLSGTNIYEISNVVLNSNINMNGVEENNLVIMGPKIDNNKEIRYKYKNDNNSYSDPEIFALKKKTINMNNKEKIDGVCLQIFQSELDINEQSIVYFYLANITRSIIPDINNESLKEEILKIKEEFLFGYRIILSHLKTIDSPYVKPKEYRENVCFIEYNHQYFLPREYFNENSILIIECFCLPVVSYSEKINGLSDDKKEFIGKLLAPVNIGIVKINYNDLKKGKFKYCLENNGIEDQNNFLIINGGDDTINNINLKKIEGKDYSIGGDSYLEKVINKDFIDKARNNPDIKEEIKNKYFNVCFDSEFDNEDGQNFLFRPNEEMDENDFIRDISEQISEEEVQKIKSNKKYNFLPYCEKYIDEHTLNESNNLKCLTEQEKNAIIQNYQKGQWIYKFPEIKVKLLSKNLGVIKSNNELTQMLYSTGDKQFLNIDNLGKDEDKLMIISENNFNIFDMKEMYDMENFDNFQWKTSIKFNNPLQMNSFLKLLTLARQNINMKKKNEIQNNEIDPLKIEYFGGQKYDESNNDEVNFERLGMGNKNSTCVINVDFIEFREDFKIENDPTLLEVILLIEGQVKAGRTILEFLNDSNYGFQNALLIENEKIKNTVSKIQSDNGKQWRKELFPKKVKLSKSNFNNGKKTIILGGHLKTQFEFNKSLVNKNSYELEIILSKQDEYFSKLDLGTIINETMCNKIELPIYKKNDKMDKIYGAIGIDLYELDNNSDKTFEERFEELNRRFLNEPLLIVKELLKKDFSDFKIENYHIELYEPNIYRRYILNFIHNEKDINVDPRDMENSLVNDLDILYERLYKKYAILPKRESFQFFNFYNIKKNFGIGKNSFKKEIGLELLKIQRHGAFMQLFREKEWELYLNEINQGENNLRGIDYFMNINNKKILLNDNEQSNKLHNLIYMGIPSLIYRKSIYKTLLEVNNLFEKTIELIHTKYGKDLTNPQQCFNYFADQLFENNEKTNLIFSLIDNDSTFISSLGSNSYEDINSIKKIAKSFFIWAELRIGLKKKEDKYVYFIGLLSIIQKLRQYFKEDNLVFWLLIGLSQYMAHFHQENPLFSEEMNYINIYGLVTKLILETHHKKIYDKFLSLNFPPEFFLSQHLSTLYTDYFQDEFMMRIFDILIFESAFQGLYGDNLQYLRILCAIPITLFELSQEKILLCKSVSEIESIFNDLISHTFNHNKFIFTLGKNVNKFYVVSNFFEKWLFNNRGREWDSKRDEIQNLIYQHFIPVYKENYNYLFPISNNLDNNGLQMFKFYFGNISNKLDSIKSLYGQGSSNFNDPNSITGIMVHISKLQQIFNNDINIDEYKLIVSFGDNSLEMSKKYHKSEFNISFDSKFNEIKNTSDLFFKEQFKEDQFPKYIHFSLKDNLYKDIASFSYQILYYEPMKISKITLENKEENKKFFMEFVLFKYSLANLSADDIALFNTVFSSPEYLHSKSIEEKLYSCSISNYSFNRYISQLIKEQNNKRNNMIDNNLFNENLVDMYKKLNNNEEQEDKYNTEKIMNIKNSSPFNDKVSQKTTKILDSSLQENIHDIIHTWLKNSNISIEEMLYSIILIDKSLISINEKLFLLYSIAQTKDKLLFNIDEISITKVKEIIYSLYKRFMIYFTKTDVERMIDFLLKNERLFNIRYAFVYNQKDVQKINEIIYEKDYYEPKLNNKKQFEIYFDDINKELNIFLNHLNNHYNMNCLSKDLLVYVLTKIINSKDLTRLIQNNFDKITLVIEKDNLMYKRNFTINYSPLKIVEDYNQNFDVLPKNQEDVPNIVLCNEISNFNTNNSYNVNNYISFDKFKEIFFKLPYLSDLFRVSFSYISEDKDTYNKEFEYLKVYIGYEIDSYLGIFYFPDLIEEDNIENKYEGNVSYSMNKKIKITNTIDSIMSDIIKKINDKVKLNNSELSIIDCLKSIDKLNCYVCYYINEDQKEEIVKEKIGYFDCLYSCMELKNKNYVEIQIIFDNDFLTFNSSRNPVPRGPGYCKIFYSNDNDFIWKKCKVKSKNIADAKLDSTDYKTKLNIKNRDDDVVLAYNI